MKKIFILVILALQFMESCKTATVTAQEDVPLGYQDVVKDEPEDEPKKQVAAISLEELLGSKNYTVLTHTDSLSISNIQPVLIEGTTDEYGRTLQAIKTVHIADVGFMNSLLDNKNYVEIMDTYFLFNPTVQFQLNHQEDQLVLLFDKETGTLGFASLEGPTILKISEPLQKEITKLLGD